MRKWHGRGKQAATLVSRMFVCVYSSISQSPRRSCRIGAASWTTTRGDIIVCLLYCASEQYSGNPYEVTGAAARRPTNVERCNQEKRTSLPKRCAGYAEDWCVATNAKEKRATKTESQIVAFNANHTPSSNEAITTAGRRDNVDVPPVHVGEGPTPS